MRTPALSVFIPLLAFAACQLPSHQQSEERSIRIDAAGLRTMHCATHNGDIAIVAGAGTTVEGTAKVTGYGDSDEEARETLTKLTVKQELAGSELRLWLDVPRELSGDISFSLIVPSSVLLLTTTHNGSVRVDNADAGLTAETHNGGIQFDSIAGPLRLTAHNGAIEGSIRGKQLDGVMETHNGEIALRLARDCSARVTAQTNNGSISLAGASEASLSQGSSSGVYGDGLGKLELLTHNGGVTVRVQ